MAIHNFCSDTPSSLWLAASGFSMGEHQSRDHSSDQQSLSNPTITQRDHQLSLALSLSLSLSLFCSLPFPLSLSCSLPSLSLCLSLLSSVCLPQPSHSRIIISLPERATESRRERKADLKMLYELLEYFDWESSNHHFCFS